MCVYVCIFMYVYAYIHIYCVFSIYIVAHRNFHLANVSQVELEVCVWVKSLETKRKPHRPYTLLVPKRDTLAGGGHTPSGYDCLMSGLDCPLPGHGCLISGRDCLICAMFARQGGCNNACTSGGAS